MFVSKQFSRSLKAQILLPLSVVFLILTLIVVGIFYFHFKNDFEHTIESTNAEIQKFYSDTLELRASKLAAGLAFIQHNAHLLKLWQKNDREALLSESLPLFKKLKKDFNITHFYFHQANKVNFLRVHQPDRYGDSIARETLQISAKEKKISIGTELGPLGTYTLRAVAPVYLKDKLLGYAELGEEVDDIVFQIKKLFNVEALLVIDKKLIDKKKWQQLLKRNKGAKYESLINGHFVITNTIQSIPDLFIKNMGNIYNNDHQYRFDFSLDDKIYSVWGFYIKDSYKKEIISQEHEFIIVKDITEHNDDFNISILSFIISTILLFGFLLLIFYRITTKTDKKIKEYQNNLEDLIELRTSSLKRAEAIAHVGSWFLDVKSNTISWSDETYRMFNVEPNTEVTLEKFLSFIHADDIEYVTKHWTRAMNGLPYDIDHRVIVEGKVKWVHETAEVLFDDQQNPLTANGAVQDITERKENERNLLKALETSNNAKVEAELATQLKSDFLANMSHELRTPMHGILSFASLGIHKNASLSPEKTLKYFTMINESGERLMLLLNDLLDLSKLEAGHMDFNYKKSDFMEVVDTVTSELSEVFINKSLGFSIINQAENTIAEFDEYKISQVLRNLLSNAIKFTPKGKSIKVICKDASLKNHTHNEETISALSVTVSDEGVGVPEDEVDSIMEKFTQSKANEASSGGTGLGLAICKEIIKAHDGIIKVKNNSGDGLSVTFIIPIAQVGANNN